MFTMVVALLLSRLDLGNAIPVGVLGYFTQRLSGFWMQPLGWYSRLHWLKAPELISYKVAVLMYQCQHGLATTYLSGELRRPADTEARQRLHSACSIYLAVQCTRLSTVGDRAFLAASACLRNDLPYPVTAAQSLQLSLFSVCKYATDRN